MGYAGATWPFPNSSARNTLGADMTCAIEHVQEAQLRAEELRSQINYHDYLYYVKDGDRNQRRRIRRADAPPAGDRGALSRSSSRPSRRRSACRTCRSRRSPWSSTASPCCRWPTRSTTNELQAWYKRATGLAERENFRDRVRAEDRRPRRVAGLRERALRAGGHARRRTARREHHGEHAHDPQRPDGAARQEATRSASRCAARCTCRSRRSSG